MGLDPEFLMIRELESRYSHLLAESGWLGMDVRMGWVPIVRELLARMDTELTRFEKRRVRLSQVKQKWAELRVHYVIDGSPPRLHVDVRDSRPAGVSLHMVVNERRGRLEEKIDSFIEAAAAIASRTCEACAAPGRRVNSNGWLMVACHRHAGDAM